MLLLPMQNSSFSLVLLMYPYNLSALPIKTNGAFPLLCCDKIEHNEWHLESAKLQAASRSYHVLLLQCHLLTFFTKQNVYLICSFLRMHLLKSRSPGGGVAYIYIYIYILWVHWSHGHRETKYLGICFWVERTTVMTGTHRIDKTAHETASSACLWPASCLGHVGPTAAAHVKGSMAVRLMSEFQKMWANARTWMCVGMGGAKQIPPPLESLRQPREVDPLTLSSERRKVGDLPPVPLIPGGLHLSLS